MAGKKKPKSAEFTLPKGSGETQPPKKKKKNAPDRPQPAWLFPPDEENPVLNPKQKSQEQIDKDVKERLEAIKFLRHKAVNAPVKPAPPTMLLTLIGAFLASYGFNSTGRLFTLERNARKRLDGWDDQVGAKIPKDMPDLVKIYKQWYKDWQDAKADDDSDKEVVESVDDGTSNPTKSNKGSHRITKPVEDTSSSGSESGSSKDSELKVNGKKRSSKSSSTSTSESDADDEKGITKAPSTQPQIERFGKGLKRKPMGGAVESSLESDSDFDSESDRAARKKRKQQKDKATEAIEPVAKNSIIPNSKPVKTNGESAIVAEVKGKSSSESASSSSSGSSSSGNESDSAPKVNANEVTAQIATSSPPLSNQTSSADSSTTMDATIPTNSVTHLTAPFPSTSSSSSSSSASPSPPPKKADKPKKFSKRKRSASPPPRTNADARNDSSAVKPVSEPSGEPAKRSKKDKTVPKTSTPFKRIPENQVIDPRLASNAYVPYDYAHKAHEDLSVTRGKGFTKEKNKKKRGAYRGGAIDVGGGKGVKFED